MDVCSRGHFVIVFAILSGLEKEPKLSAVLVPVLHKFAVTQKLSPVKVTNVLFGSFTFYLEKYGQARV